MDKKHGYIDSIGLTYLLLLSSHQIENLLLYHVDQECVIGSNDIFCKGTFYFHCRKLWMLSIRKTPQKLNEIERERLVFNRQWIWCLLNNMLKLFLLFDWFIIDAYLICLFHTPRIDWNIEICFSCDYISLEKWVIIVTTPV